MSDPHDPIDDLWQDTLGTPAGDRVVGGWNLDRIASAPLPTEPPPKRKPLPTDAPKRSRGSSGDASRSVAGRGSGSSSGKRRLRVSGLDAWLVLGIGLVAGVGVLVDGPAPTGSRGVDVALLLLATTAVVWFAASAAWWSIVAAGAIAAALSPSPWWLAVAAAGTALGLVIGISGWAQPWRRAIAMGLTLVALAHLGEVQRFGVSSIVGIVIALTVAIVGLTRRSRRERRIAYAFTGGLFLLAVASAAGFGVAANGTRDALDAGNREAREGLRLLASGDFTAAQEPLRAAAESFARAESELDPLWAKPAALVPVVAQHRTFARELAHTAATSLVDISTAVGGIDIDSLEVIGGTIDVGSVQALQPQLQQLTDAIDHLATTLDQVDSPWLVAAIRDRVDTLRTDITKQQTRGHRALEALERAPALLGDDTTRRYLLVFTTPAEARGLGGFMGNYAEITIANGAISLAKFGRTQQLNDFPSATEAAVRTVTGPTDWLSRYGQFGFVKDDGHTGKVPWSSVTMSPDFAATAEVISELYPQSGGRPIDGVIALDVDGLAGLMQLTGPITVPGLEQPLDSSNAARFMLQDQYLLTDTDERADLLQAIAQATVDQLLGGVIPSPVEIGRVLGPLVTEGRISMWTDRPEEQQFFRDIGMLHELPLAGATDGALITFNNASANKIDVYLERSVTYATTLDPATGEATTTMTVSMTNTAPASGLPTYVIGNLAEKPVGTNLTYLSVYSPQTVTSATLDGQPFDLSRTTERNWQVWSNFVEIPSGTTRTLVVQLAGTIDLTNGYQLFVRPQPLVTPETWSVTVDLGDGRGAVSLHDGELDRPTTFTARSAA